MSRRGLEDNLYRNGKYFRYKNPVTGEFTGFGTDLEQANKAARTLNQSLQPDLDKLYARRALKKEHLSVKHVVNEYVQKRLPERALKPKSQENALLALRRFAEQCGHMHVDDITRTFIDEWLCDTTTSNGSYNKNLFEIHNVLSYCMSRNYCSNNEASAVEKKSLSKRIAANRRVRRRIELEQFLEWRQKPSTERWLLRAALLSLITTQARGEIVSLTDDNIRDGWLYITRAKVEEHEHAHVRYRVEGSLKQLLDECMNDRPAGCRFVVTREPERKVGAAGREHPWQVLPGFLSKAFTKSIRLSGLFQHLSDPEKPTFHEVRSLGARLYKAQGRETPDIQAMLAHGDEKTTRIYLSGGEIHDEDFAPVSNLLDVSRLI